MSKPKGGTRNSDRKNGKAWKKRPKKNRSRGKTVGGYSKAKLALRQSKRQNQNPSVVNVDNGDSVGTNVTSANLSEG